jgi:hypothetical protein
MNDADPLIRRLADANPASEADAQHLARLTSERLLAQLTSGRRPPPAHLGRTPLRVVVTVVALFVGVVAVVVVRSGDQAPATAAELLTRTAAVAQGASPMEGGGPYVYAKTTSEQLTSAGEGGEIWSVIQPIEEETWIAPDGSGRMRAVLGQARFPGPRDEERWRTSGAPEFPSGTSDDTFPAGVLTFEDLESLPMDPHELLPVLRDQVSSEGVSGDPGVFLRIGQLLSRGDAPAALRASLYRAAAKLTGIELVGPITDPTGRPGVGVAMTYEEMGASIRAVMIFDEETSELLAQEQILLEPASWVDAKAGTRLSFIAYIGSGRVGSVEATTTSPTP